MAVYKRRHLTEFVLRYTAEQRDRLKGEIELDLWAGLSPDDPHLQEFEELCSELGWNYAIVQNNPLWMKWNALVDQMVKSVPVRDIKGVLVMGSDDLANDAFVRGIWALLNSSVEYIQPTGCIMFHPESGNMSFLSAFQGGAGRAFSLSLCEKANWQLWAENEDMKSVDIWQQKHLLQFAEKKSQLPVTMLSEWQMIDIKTSGGDNMWDWQQFSPNVNILTQWLEAEGTLNEAFPGYFEPIEEGAEA